jgi:hypothetical protein
MVSIEEGWVVVKWKREESRLKTEAMLPQKQ